MDIEFALLKSKPDSLVAQIPDDLIHVIISYIRIERLHILKHKNAIYYSTFALDLEDFITKYLVYVKNTWCRSSIHCSNCLNCFLNHEDVILSNTNLRCCVLSEKINEVNAQIDLYLRDISRFIKDFNKNLTNKDYSISTNQN